MKYRSKSQIFIAVTLVTLLVIGCNESAQIETESTARDSLVVEMTATDSITPLELLLDNHQVEYRGSIMGAFVTSVDSVENSSTAFWIYTVNDTTPKVACDKMSLNAGDQLKWQYRRVSSESSSDNSSTD